MKSDFTTIVSVMAIISLACTIIRTEGASPSCDSSQSYSVTVRLSFTPNVDARIPQPSKARIPILVAVTHRKDFTLFQISKRLNDSVAEVASAATAADLLEVLEVAIEDGRVSSYTILPKEDEDNFRVNDVVKFDIHAEKSSTYVSIMAQLSPSPSWFVGVEAFDLCREKAGSDGAFAFITEVNDIVFGNFNAGLDKGSSFEADPDPYEVGATVPVSPVDGLSDAKLATMSLVQSSSRFNWWIILLSVLVGITVIALLVVLALWILKRIRSSREKEEVPLTSNERVEW